MTGTFDDCQAIVKALFQDQGLRQAVDLSGVNSINFARIAAQAVYYFTTAVALGAPHRPVSFAVPTGNFGDAFAGYVAQRMGLPIERIVVATNSNDILARAFETGRYARGAVRRPRARPWTSRSPPTSSGSISRRVEREAAETARAFAAFAETGAIDIPPAGLRRHARAVPRRRRSARPRPRATIVATLNETGELIDPHTAVAVAAARASGRRPADAAGGALHRPPGQVPRGRRARPPASTPRPAARRARTSPPSPSASTACPPTPRRSRPTSAPSRRAEAIAPPVHTPGQRRPRRLRPDARAARPWRCRWSPAAARAAEDAGAAPAGRTCWSTWCSRAPATARPATSSRSIEAEGGQHQRRHRL